MGIVVSRAEAIEKISVSNYRVIELIGSGGMANIYKAIQLSLDRPVALKIMHQHLSMNEGFVARFEMEAKQAAQLHHENIVSIIDYGQEYGNYYIAMEYVDGNNLKQLLEKQNRLPLEISLLICHQVAEGLKYAHSQNLVHRDIKPANIILSNDGRVMITDFGIAKGDADLSITATGQMIGSPAYMSPEQAAGRPIDHRTDIFSLGIILYETIAGEKPFKGDTYQAMVTSVMSQLPEPLRKIRVDVNSEIEAIAEKAIAKDVDSRYQSAEEIADAIYAQLERFKLPPGRKLISSFLKNPGRVTEKLRVEKVSNHMESALYFLTQGESRLKEAKREFEDVLRFDKNNKSAKKYIAKIDSHISTSVNLSLGARSRTKARLLKILGAIAIMSGVILALLFLPRWDEVKEKLLKHSSNIDSLHQQSKVSDKTGKAAGTDKSKPPDARAGADKAAESKKGNISKVTDKGSQQKDKSGAKSAQKENTTAKSKSAGYNYPDQNIKEYGLLTVKTNVPAEIYIDLKRYGASNGPAVRIQPGRHFVEIKADGYRRMTRRIFTEKDKSTDLKINLVTER